jgi:diguanylate cyclase (GGDEF)-like protein
MAGWNARRYGSAIQRVLGSAARGDVARQIEQLQDQAWRDPLTGLLNRAGFDAWRKANPSWSRHCALVAMDLDGFKPINDQHGHAAGDAVLQGIGAWLRGNIRAQDAAVRMGGDEFVLCFPGFPEQVSEAAREVTARLNAALNEGLPTPAGRLRLGCSVGIALLRHDAPDFETAMADAALYAAKRQRQRTGRDAAFGSHPASITWPIPGWGWSACSASRRPAAGPGWRRRAAPLDAGAQPLFPPARLGPGFRSENNDLSASGGEANGPAGTCHACG